MKRYLILYSALISVLLLGSCNTAYYNKLTKGGSYFKGGEEDISGFRNCYPDEGLYRFSIDFFGRNFHGLLLMKNTQQGSRIALTSELGLKYADLEISSEGVRYHYVADFMDRKKLLRVLGSDLAFIFMMPDINDGIIISDNGLILKKGSDAWHLSNNDGSSECRLEYFRRKSLKKSLETNRAGSSISMNHERLNITYLIQFIKALP